MLIIVELGERYIHEFHCTICVCVYLKISIIKSEEKSGWINIYCAYSLEKPEVLFIVMWSIFAFVLHVAGSWQNNVITILDYESIEWVWYLSTDGIYLTQSNTQKS